MTSKQLILDRYRPVKRAGSGGFGTVIKAWDTRIQRYVAIKTIQLSERDAARAALPGADAVNRPVPLSSDQFEREPLPWEDDASDNSSESDSSESSSLDSGLSESDASPVRSLARLPGLDEARTAAMLEDQNIVSVYDFEVRGSVAYLIMEFVEGMSLSALLRDYDDQLTLNQIAAVFAGVSHALSVAHANGVLHLDIKPDNVLINGKGQVKVTDFGLATLADASGTGFAGGGTIGYMPPEQIGRQPLDERCDEWALASVVYEMLTGSNPFRTRTLEQAESAIRDAELVLPSLCWDDLAEEANDVLFDALDPCRDERYASVESFAADLLPLLGDEAHGRCELAAVVNHIDWEDVGDADELETEEDAEAAAHVRGVGARRAWRLSPRASSLLAHLAGMLGSAATAFIALFSLPVLPEGGIAAPSAYLSDPILFADHSAFWVLLAAVAVVGLVKPHMGALVSFELLGIAFIVQGQLAVGLAFMVLTALWWFFLARKSVPQQLRPGVLPDGVADVGVGFGAGFDEEEQAAGQAAAGRQRSRHSRHKGRACAPREHSSHVQANAAFCPVVLGAFGLGQLTPLIAGFSLPPLRALASAAYGALVAFVLACCTGGTLFGWDLWNAGGVPRLAGASDAAVVALQDASLWCVVVSWLLSVLVLALFRKRRTRAFAIVGTVLALCVLVVGMVAAWALTGGAGVFAPSVPDAVLATLAMVLMFAWCLLTA